MTTDQKIRVLELVLRDINAEDILETAISTFTKLCDTIEPSCEEEAKTALDAIKHISSGGCDGDGLSSAQCSLVVDLVDKCNASMWGHISE